MLSPFRVALLALSMLCFAATLLALDRQAVAVEQSSAGDLRTLPPAVQTVAKRLAIVIGNGDYENVVKLKNPRTDADAVADKLAQLGFEVVLAHDLARRPMNAAISNFLARVEPGSEAVVYYSGHGVELNGSNYLLPTDIPAIAEDRLLREEGINLSDLMLDLQSRKSNVSIVILDACRDNPLVSTDASGRTKSIGTKAGLGRVDPPQGTFVIFAAGVGQQAIDTLGNSDVNPNGLFTRELLKSMDQPNLEIREMVQDLRLRVRQDALAAGSAEQTPSYYDQLLGKFYFNGGWNAQQTPGLRPPSEGEEVAMIPKPDMTPQPRSLDGRTFRLWYKTKLDAQSTVVIKIQGEKISAAAVGEYPGNIGTFLLNKDIDAVSLLENQIDYSPAKGFQKARLSAFLTNDGIRIEIRTLLKSQGSQMDSFDRYEIRVSGNSCSFEYLSDEYFKYKKRPATHSKMVPVSTSCKML